MTCSSDLENLANDLTAIMAGSDIETVQLSDTTVVKSLRKTASDIIFGSGYAYDATKEYSAGAIVSFNGGMYIAISESVGKDPTNSVFWKASGSSNLRIKGQASVLYDFSTAAVSFLSNDGSFDSVAVSSDSGAGVNDIVLEFAINSAVSKSINMPIFTVNKSIISGNKEYFRTGTNSTVRSVACYFTFKLLQNSNGVLRVAFRIGNTIEPNLWNPTIHVGLM